MVAPSLVCNNIMWQPHLCKDFLTRKYSKNERRKTHGYTVSLVGLRARMKYIICIYQMMFLSLPCRILTVTLVCNFMIKLSTSFPSCHCASLFFTPLLMIIVWLEMEKRSTCCEKGEWNFTQRGSHIYDDQILPLISRENEKKVSTKNNLFSIPVGSLLPGSDYL